MKITDNKKKEIITRIILGVVLAGAMIMIIISASLLLGCQSAPDRKDYNSSIEFMVAECGYRYQKNPVVCTDIIKRYSDFNKEQSYYARLKFCNNKENLLPHWNGDTEKCLYYLNQK